MSALLILASQLADLAAFGLVVQIHGNIAGELNPIAHALPLPYLVAIKVAGAILLALIASRLARKWGLAISWVGLAGAMSAIGVMV